MPSNLDRLLDSIDPSRTFDKVSADVDLAVNSFTMRKATTENWDEYEDCLTSFCRHVEKEVLRYGSGVPDNKAFYWTQCSNILNEEFGSSGWKDAFEMTSTGKEGGLYRILRLIAEKMTESYFRHEISARISDYLRSLTNDEKLAAANEYVGKYGHLLPREYTEANAARLKVNFQNVLKEHPGIIRRMRRIGR